MDYKFHFFPAAFPDETLHSVLSRYVRLCGIGSRQAAFAGERAAASFSQNVAFPSRLAEFVESLPRGTGLSVLGVIRRHTLLPYYAPFLTRAQLDQMQASMAGDGKGLMLKAGVYASRLAGASRVRFCPSCITEDRAHAGAAYWHRVHQIPGVLVCPHHGRMLKIVDPSRYSRYSRLLNMPDEDSVQAHSVQLDAPTDTIPGLHKIALSSLQLLSVELTTLSASSVRSCLLQGAADLDLASGAHRLNLHKLAGHMASFFKTLPAAWEYSILGESPADAPATWVTKLLRKPRRTHHPLKFIVLANALKVDLASMLSINSPCIPEVKRVSMRAVPSRQSVPIGPAIERLDRLPAAVWKLALAGAEAREIASALDVSRVFVYRSIRAIDGGPDSWRKARFIKELSDRRAAFESEYRLLHAHDCQGYAWLYRCDRDWLSDCVAKRGSAHANRADCAGKFAALDATLARQVSECAERLRALSGKPVRISRTRIGRELHVLSRFEKQLSKLPLCAAALARACESSEEFHVRRLQWAEAKLLSERQVVTRSALYRTACIRSAR